MNAIILPAGTEYVQFGELAFLIAEALWPFDALGCEFARINLEKELKEAASLNALPVIDALTRGPHSFPIGYSLQIALVKVADLRRYVAPRGISVNVDTPSRVFVLSARPVCVDPELLAMNPGDKVRWRSDIGTGSGNGICDVTKYIEQIEATMKLQSEGYFTVEEAAQILADATGSPVETQLGKLHRAIENRALFALDQDDKMPVLDGVKDFSSVLRESELVAAGFAFPNLEAKPAQPLPKQDSTNEWATDAQSRAREIIKEQKARDLYPDQMGIADQIAREFRVAGRVGAGGKPLSGAYIKRHTLKGISSADGKQLSTAIRRGK